MKEKRKKIIAIIFGIISFFLLPSSFFPVSAQEVSQSIDLFVESVPSDPQPGQTVSLEAKSYSVDVSQEMLSWTYGGKSLGSGIGKTKVVVTAPDAGSLATATVTLSGSGIGSTSASIALRPASIDMLWEAVDASVPPFYKGRPLLAPGGRVHIVGVSAAGAPKQLSWQWARNGSALSAFSGIGKESILITNDILRSNETIEVTAAGGLFQGKGSTAFSSRPPGLVAYERKEGFLDYSNGSVGNITVNNPGIVLRFEPFFFTVNESAVRDLSFSVTANGEPVVGDDEMNEVRLSRPEKGGEVDMNVRATTNAYSVQNAARTFKILFE